MDAKFVACAYFRALVDKVTLKRNKRNSYYLMNKENMTSSQNNFKYFRSMYKIILVFKTKNKLHNRDGGQVFKMLDLEN